MKIKSGFTLKLINIILPILIAAGFFFLFLHNYLYNTKDRSHKFTDAKREGTAYVFDDVKIDLFMRGGDSGSWVSDNLKDNDGEMIYQNAIGAVYEMEIINTNKSDLLCDWTATIYIPEEMLVNDTWNGDFEYHQSALSDNERVQTLKLSQYSNYDIELEHYMTHAGPMVRLYPGDRFVYHPSVDLGENSIVPKKNESNGSVKIGFIVYLPNRELDYVAGFSGRIDYHLQTSVYKNPFFWVLVGLTGLWLSCVIALVIVKLNLKRYEEQKKRDAATIEQTMQTFVNFIEAKDPSTMGHSLRVAQYSKMIAEKLGFPENECDQIYWIALMHDCGKIYIADNILGKPGALTDEEYEIMKKHTVYGGEILRDFTAIDNIRMGAMCHHERYDGRGYPNGLAGEDIPMIGRIICVCDAFDAMNSRRCYRNSLSADIILDELKKNKGKQFDPHIVDVMLSLIDSKAIYIGDRKKSHNK
ncbi:MAG: HD-GYP domain-containing protein [Oscillospiraceae bacterium]|nr:HD-GYP domain-containing protein [Oscillospiraceae bacterium]